MRAAAKRSLSRAADDAGPEGAVLKFWLAWLKSVGLQ